MTESIGVPGPRRGKAFVALLLGAALVILFVGFIALGSWQIQRLGWKQDLIARVEQRMASAPVAPPGAAQWPAIARATDEYRRVRLTGRLDHARETLVGASTALGTGYWVLTPLRVEPADAPAFWVLVNRGFIPLDLRDPAKRAASASDAPVALEGLLRLSEPLGSLLQKNDPAAGRWYSRDVAAIAAARGLDGPVAPYFVDVWPEPPVSARGIEVWPHPGLTVLQFSNNHRSYAMTWFAMAAMVAGIAVYLLRERRRGSSATDADRDPDSRRPAD